MTDRDKLPDFPCPHVVHGPCMQNPGAGCPPGHTERCEVLPVYRELIKLRDDMRKLRAAVLGDMTPAEGAYAYRSIAPEAWNHPFLRNDQHFTILARVVAKL